MNKPTNLHRQGPEFFEPIRSPYSISEAWPHLPQPPKISNRCTSESPDHGLKNPNAFNGGKLPIFPGTDCPPLNLCGGGSYRFPGALTERRRQHLAAAIDAELGTPPSKPVISSHGVRAFPIPGRRAR